MPNIEKHLKRIERTKKPFQIPGIDYIYLINLDSRPEKLERSVRQLKRYGIEAERLAAIYGWTLSQDVFDDIGMKFLPPMDFRFDGSVFFRPASDQLDAGEKLDASCYGKTCVHQTTSAGSLGGSLSHLSCLQDAYEKGSETVWILEDDFTLEKDPKILSSIILSLDQLIGKENWDLLYTDDDHHFNRYGDLTIDPRPDRPPFRLVVEHTPIGQGFVRIGGRHQLHSVIYRKSGIEKILNYIKTFGLFHTFDVEINFTPELKKYNFQNAPVHGRGRTTSDTQMKCF